MALSHLVYIFVVRSLDIHLYKRIDRCPCRIRVPFQFDIRQSQNMHRLVLVVLSWVECHKMNQSIHYHNNIYRCCCKYYLFDRERMSSKYIVHIHNWSLHSYYDTDNWILYLDLVSKYKYYQAHTDWDYSRNIDKVHRNNLSDRYSEHRQQCQRTGLRFDIVSLCTVWKFHNISQSILGQKMLACWARRCRYTLTMRCAEIWWTILGFAVGTVVSRITFTGTSTCLIHIDVTVYTIWCRTLVHLAVIAGHIDRTGTVAFAKPIEDNLTAVLTRDIATLLIAKLTCPSNIADARVEKVTGACAMYTLTFIYTTRSNWS